MKLISPGSRVKFFTVKPINTKFQITFLSGTVHEDNGNRVTVWTDDSRTFHVPYEYITDIPRLPFLLMNLFLKAGDSL